MDYDDKFEVSSISSVGNKSQSQGFGNFGSSTASQEKFPTKEEIVDLVLERFGQTFRPANRFQNYVP